MYQLTPQGEYCSVTVKGKSVGILRPITYMNNSGMSARKVREEEPARLVFGSSLDAHFMYGFEMKIGNQIRTPPRIRDGTPCGVKRFSVK